MLKNRAIFEGLFRPIYGAGGTLQDTLSQTVPLIRLSALFTMLYQAEQCLSGTLSQFSH